METDVPEFACSDCGKVHSPDELELVFFRPDPIVAMPKDQRDALAKETNDLCSIELDRFFVRAILPLPVSDRSKDYSLGVWAELSKDAFFRIIELWDEPSQDIEPSFSATLANHIPYLPETCGLSVQLHLTGPTTRPKLTIPPSDHPLYQEQCKGITSHRASQYTESIRVQG